MSDKKKKKSLISIAIVVFFGLVFLYIQLSDSEESNETSIVLVKDSYELTFSKNFKPVLSSQDDLGLSIFIGVDCSGSMFDTPASGKDFRAKYLQASESLQDIVEFFEDFYKKEKNSGLILKLALVGFSSEVKPLFELTEMDSGSFAELKSIVSDPDNFLPEGPTALGRTLEYGSEVLAQSGTIFKSLIIVTDGANTSGVLPEIVLDAIVFNKNNFRDGNFPVYTNNILVSFVGFDITSNLFSNLENGGARIMSASDKNELGQSLKTLFLADISRLEG
ncbi:MAG: VWA domain-containing protein [Spirochaetales bacterium]|nr:VWA domain-containing protein [Spirochaetales bacterium]